MERFESIEAVLQYAIERETDSMDTYLDLASRCQNLNTRRVLRELAEQELVHKNTLELEVIKIGRVVPYTPKDAYVMEEIFEEYCEDSSEGSDLSEAEAVMLAIQREQSSFRLYIEMTGYFEDINAREGLTELAEEEARHKFVLEGILARMGEQ